MRYVKLFEEFENAGPKTYILYVNNSSKDNFQADIRDQDGRIIHEIKAKDLNNDSLMKSENDIPGLVALLISKNKIKPGDTIVNSKEYKDPNSEEFTPAFNTNNH